MSNNIPYSSIMLNANLNNGYGQSIPVMQQYRSSNLMQQSNYPVQDFGFLRTNDKILVPNVQMPEQTQPVKTEESASQEDSLTNSRGYEICGHLNQHNKPCKRIGYCPFHGGKRKDTAKKKKKNLNIKRAPYKQGWTKEEHLRFLTGLQIHGKGAWKAIAQIVGTRTPTQIQSHAQKYFLRQQQKVKNKRSIHDFTIEDLQKALAAESKLKSQPFFQHTNVQQPVPQPQSQIPQIPQQRMEQDVWNKDMFQTFQPEHFGFNQVLMPTKQEHYMTPPPPTMHQMNPLPEMEFFSTLETLYPPYPQYNDPLGLSLNCTSDGLQTHHQMNTFVQDFQMGKRSTTDTPNESPANKRVRYTM